MGRLLVFLGLLLALGAPAHALSPRARASLSPNPCNGVTLKTDFAANGGGGVFCLNGQRYGSFTAMPGASYAGSVSGTGATVRTAANSAGEVVSFANGVPRITDLGLLVEEARTNLVLQSQALAAAAWSGVASRVNNAAVAPNGTTTASSVSQSGQFQGANQTITVAPSTTYHLTAYIKLVSGNQSLVMQSFDVTNSTFLVVQNISVNSVWARYEAIFTTGGNTTSVQVSVQDNNASGFGTFDVWGVQLEAGAFATSYIPTTSAAATRAADVAFTTGIVSPPAFTLLANFITNQVSPSNEIAASFDDASSNNRAQLGSGVSGVNFLIEAGGTIAINGSVAGATQAGAKLAMRVAPNDAAIYYGGASVGAASTVTVPSSSRVALGIDRFNASPINGVMRQVTLYPSGLSNAQLQALTQ